MKIAFKTLGCKLNYAETSTYERGFRALGYEVTLWDSPADVYVLNSCAVTEMAEAKSRNLIRRAVRTAPGATVVVTGCYAELRREEVLAIEGVSRVFGADEKARLVSETAELAERRSSRPDGLGMTKGTDSTVVQGSQFVMPSECEGTSFPAYSSGERTRSFLKVQDGCDNFCAYCTVPFARGRSRNIPICSLVRQAREIAAKGIKEIVLTGVNTGDFGKSTLESFLDLLKALDEVEGIERYRISSIEPNLITEEIIDWIASGTKFQPHFHIPLQSGSDTLLRKVGRRYDTALFASRIDYIRAKMEGPGKPPVFFGIDVIVGLPGETDELFDETVRFLRDRVKPAFIHVFPYSKRPGTRAASFPGQLTARVKAERVAALESLCEELHAQFVESCRGVREKVLWESADKDGIMYGYTGNYIRLSRPFDKDLSGKITEVTI